MAGETLLEHLRLLPFVSQKSSRTLGTFTTSSMSHRSSAVNLGQVKQRQILAEAKWGTKI